jgi:coenzyme F420-0:L-glutamate ligase/coenzyme F420-1:gamma-L-glutamate ligase
MLSTSGRVELVALMGIPEIRPGDDLAALVLEACRRQSIELRDDDVLVVTQKALSKAESRLVDLDDVKPCSLANRFAERAQKDPRVVELVLEQAERVIKMERGLLITETRHGFVCANSGVDTSNLETETQACLLPVDPDDSARKIRRNIRARSGKSPAVLVSDTFGRPFREGLTNVAIGAAGLRVLVDFRGQRDPAGRTLFATVVAIADEIAAAAGLVMGKLARVPAALARGVTFEHIELETDDSFSDARALVRDPERDLFR